MRRFPQRFALSAVACALVMVLGLAAWAQATDPSEAQTGSMQNCPPAGMWSISVWDGESGTAATDALATCGPDAVDAVYSLDAQTGGWWRWFAANPGVSDLPPLSDKQGVLALGSATGPLVTPTPTATGTPTATPTPSPTATPAAAPIVFTGQGDKDTAAFSVATWSFTVQWTTSSGSPEYAGFGFFVYPEGETVGYVCDADFDGVGTDSTVCRGGPGQFYVKVLAANLSSWRIEITGPPAVASLPASFTGRGDKDTPAFHVSGSTFTVDWTTASDSPEWASLAFFVYPEGETVGYVCDADFDGVGSDNTVCHAGPGDFYVKVLAANLTSWQLDID